MKNSSEIINKIRDNFTDRLDQILRNMFEYESTEMWVGDGKYEVRGDNRTRDTIFLISSPASMNSNDYIPTRFKCAVHAVVEYMRIRTKLCANDRIGVVYFNNESRFIIHLTRIDELCLEWGRDFEPRGTVYMEKGFGGANRILKRQKNQTTLSYMVLITDTPFHLNGCSRFIEKLMKKRDFRFEVVALAPDSKFMGEPTGFRQFVVSNTEDLIEHVRLLAENQV